MYVFFSSYQYHMDRVYIYLAPLILSSTGTYEMDTCFVLFYFSTAKKVSSRSIDERERVRVRSMAGRQRQRRQRRQQ